MTPDIAPEDLRRVHEEFEAQFPEVWRRCYTRVYNEPKGNYYSPKEPAHQMMGVAVKMMLGARGGSDTYEFHACSQLARFGLPMYWLTADMLEALMRTTPPQDIPWYTMAMPFEAGVLMLPKGTLVHPDEGDFGFVGWARFKTGEEHESKLLPGYTYGSINGGMMFIGVTMKGLHFFHWNLPLSAYGPSIRLPDIDDLVMLYAEESRNHHVTDFVYSKQPYMTDTDNHMMSKIAHLVFSALLIMDARPELVTPGRLLKRVERRDQHKEFWSPNILGESYRLQREGRAAEGSHGSPRFHWVRGFWREQAYGPQHSLRKRMWVEPFTRGLEL